MVKLPAAPPPYWEVLGDDNNVLKKVVNIGPTVDGRYLHWDEIRRRRPPEGLTAEEWWAGVFLSRSMVARDTQILNAQGKPFCYSMVDPVLEGLYHLDQKAKGRAVAPATYIDRKSREQYRIRGLIEEAISSSQLEGAVTTRVDAKEMLRRGRRPRDHSEQMIVNNYRAILRIKEIVDRQMTPELICELHDLLTSDTLNDPDDCGRFQQPGEKRAEVVSYDESVLLHTPPPASEIPERIARLCRFANGEGEQFTHPLVRAITLHFWLSYIHPFVDGNGRTARALFYWSALRDGYWLIEYVSISSAILKAPAKYRDAFLYSETYESDITYFLIHQLGVLDQSFRKLSEYVDSVLARSQELKELIGDFPSINNRQRALLGHALWNPEAVYTYQGHAASHAASRGTARNDLVALSDLGLLKRALDGKQTVFTVPPDLTDRLQESLG